MMNERGEPSLSGVAPAFSMALKKAKLPCCLASQVRALPLASQTKAFAEFAHFGHLTTRQHAFR